MLVEKEIHRVSIFCRDGACITGDIHINPGERIIDFLNDPKEAFIVVTNSQFRGLGEVKSFRLYMINAVGNKATTFYLLKNAVKYAVEV